MTSRRPHRVSIRSVVWGLLAIVFMTVVSAAEAILRHPVAQVAAVTLLPAGAYLLGRRHGRGYARHLDQRPVRERAADELAWLRAQVAELEHAAGRPLAAILASYRTIQRNYEARGGRS